jgi:hypothetical protein
MGSEIYKISKKEKINMISKQSLEKHNISDSLPKEWNPKTACEFCCKHQKQIRELEHIISASARYSYEYATKVVKGRFHLGEKIISTNSGFAWAYAKSVIKGRWVEAEATIAKDIKISYQYAKDFGLAFSGFSI